MFAYAECDALFLKIYKDEELLRALKAYIEQHECTLRRHLRLCKAGRWELFFRKKPMEKLALVYLYLPLCKARYAEKQIPDAIFFDTMDDIRIWIDDHRARTGEYGLFELNWIQLHMRLQIFKLGRLQFQKASYYGSPVYKKDGVTIRLGEKILNVHIPRGGRLDAEAYMDSFRQAVEFFGRYFPEYPTDRFMCHSWLLYPDNAKFMRSDSNILRFSSLFSVVTAIEAPEQSYLWMFGEKANSIKLIHQRKKTGSYGNTASLPQNTALQKAAVHYIQQGGTLGDAVGIYVRQSSTKRLK